MSQAKHLDDFAIIHSCFTCKHSAVCQIVDL